MLPFDFSNADIDRVRKLFPEANVEVVLDSAGKRRALKEGRYPIPSAARRQSSICCITAGGTTPSFLRSSVSSTVNRFEQLTADEAFSPVA